MGFTPLPKESTAEPSRPSSDPHPTLMHRLLNIVTCGAVPLVKAFLRQSDYACASTCAHWSKAIYDMDTSELISDPRTDAQAAVHLNAPHNSIVVFRGSQSRRDWTMNVFFWMSTPFLEKGVRCHLGFKLQWESVKERILDALRGHDMSTSVTCTGHSLGGGVATLAALELHSLGYKVRLVTFGSPRAINRAGVDLYRACGIEALRFRNGSDVVTSIPIIHLFHVSPPICIGPERSVFYVASIHDHDMAEYERNIKRLFT